MQDHTVKVIETIPRTPSAVSVRMEKPEGFGFEPGQWASFTINCDGKDVGKPLSFSSSPTEPFLEFTKRITGSLFSNGLNGLGPDSEVKFHGPLGRMFYREGIERPVFISGGIGITPVRSMLKYMEDRNLTDERILIYANRSREETAFFEEFEEMATSGNGLSVIYVFDDPPAGWTGATGFITADLLRKVVPDPGGHSFFLCGPPAMVNCLMGDLEQLGVEQSGIQYEKLKGYEGLV